MAVFILREGWGECVFGEGSARKIPNGLLMFLGVVLRGVNVSQNGSFSRFGVVLKGKMYPKWLVFLIWGAFLPQIASQMCFFEDLGCF